MEETFTVTPTPFAWSPKEFQDQINGVQAFANSVLYRPTVGLTLYDANRLHDCIMKAHRAYTDALTHLDVVIENPR